MIKNNILEKIKNKSLVISILGMGYVGLPLAIAYVEKGFKVIGLDTNFDKINKLKNGISIISTVSINKLSNALDTGCFTLSTDFRNNIPDADVCIICVPTPLNSFQEPDLSYVLSAVNTIGVLNKKEQLIILESTTYPGTTSGIVREKLEKYNKVYGKDFLLAFSPEREDPGNKKFCTITIPKIVGGVNTDSTELAVEFYKQIMLEVVTVSNADTAEAVKLTENIFRCVNIALVNELKMVYDKMGLNIFEILDAAETKPFGYMRFNPGPGLGGHCIPLDPFYLSWKAKEVGVATKFIDLAGEINRYMPDYVVDKVIKGLNQYCKSVKNSNILILGVAYKKDIEDMRETPAIPIMNKLEKLGARVKWYDLLVSDTFGVNRVRELTEEVLNKQDVVIVITDHTKVDYDFVLKHSKLIVDTRGVYSKYNNLKVIQA
jgi:UDP-N-acetyl-D-glucosamine dehydrogenase